MRRNKFSDKYGYTSPRDEFQVNTIDRRLKNRIWNVIFNRIFAVMELDSIYIKYLRDTNFMNRIHDEFFGTTYKVNSYHQSEVNNIKNSYDLMEWFEIYNFLEELVFLHYDREVERVFKICINEVLEQEMSGYRFIDDCIAPIVDDIEIKEIEEVFKSKYDSVKGHLAKALEHLSDRESPDYQNSIKESITAVETIAKIITGKETDLASCLKQMNIDLNKQFVTGMNNIYGWTCKEDGIRHGHTGEEIKTSFDEAKYMLVSCSAFINYLISKHEKNPTSAKAEDL